MKSEMLIDEYGNNRWYLNGELHRVGGPAAIYTDGSKYWCINGNRHREDGPAIEYPNGTQRWYINDKKLSQVEIETLKALL